MFRAPIASPEVVSEVSSIASRKSPNYIISYDYLTLEQDVLYVHGHCGTYGGNPGVPWDDIQFLYQPIQALRSNLLRVFFFLCQLRNKYETVTYLIKYLSFNNYLLVLTRLSKQLVPSANCTALKHSLPNISSQVPQYIDNS